MWELKQNWMQCWQYSKGVIYLRPIFRPTKLAFLRARATMKKNQSEHLEGWRKFILYKFCIIIWAVPSLHHGIVSTLLDSLSCRHGKLSSIVWHLFILRQRSAQKPARYALAGHSLTLLQKPRQTTEAIEAAIHHGNSILLYRHNFLIILSVIQ